MTEQVITNLVTAGAALVGATIGVLGTLKVTKLTIDASMKKDNFEIRKADYESQMKAIAGLRMLGHNYWLSTDRAMEDLDGSTKETVAAICDCVGASPWAFDESLRESCSRLGVEMADMQMAWHVFKTLRDGNADPKEIAESEKAARRLSEGILDRLRDMFVHSDQELSRLVKEYRGFVGAGLEFSNAESRQNQRPRAYSVTDWHSR